VSGCYTCGGFGNRHDPIAHGWMSEHDQRMTPQEWCEFKGIRILDPDGWRCAGAPDWDEPIGESEFDERAGMSTAGPWNWPPS